MNITYDLFCKCCPSATMPDEKLFRSISDYIEKAEEYVSRLTVGLSDKLLGENQSELSEHSPDLVKRAVVWMVRLICIRAYGDAIPHLDLVLTSTGFGVVSNSNLAPASADRVARLIDTVKRQEIRSYYRLIDVLRNFPEWNSTKFAKALFMTCIIWSPDEWLLFGGDVAPDDRDPIQSHSSELLNAQRLVAHLISPKFFGEIIEAIRCNNQDEPFASLIFHAQALVMALVKNDHSAEIKKGELLTFLDDNIDKFPTYAESSAYKANHFTPYENRSDDPCYFFG